LINSYYVNVKENLEVKRQWQDQMFFGEESCGSEETKAPHRKIFYPPYLTPALRIGIDCRANAEALVGFLAYTQGDINIVVL